MVERIGKEEGKILAKDEFQRATDEIKSARILQENNLFFKSIVYAYQKVGRLINVIRNMGRIFSAVPESACTHKAVCKIIVCYVYGSNVSC